MGSCGHDLASQQIAKHGRDCYPTPKQQAEKVVIEAAELLGAIAEHTNSRTHRRNHSLAGCVLVRGEYADAGQSLYELGNKLGLDLLECMAELVGADERDFRG